MRQRARRSAERAQDANASPGSEHPDSVAVIREAMSICSPRRFVKQKLASTWGLSLRCVDSRWNTQLLLCATESYNPSLNAAQILGRDCPLNSIPLFLEGDYT